MALLMFVVYVFAWVLCGWGAIDAVRLCSMYLYGVPPAPCCVYPLDCVGPVCMCFQCLYVMLLCLFFALSSMLCEWRGNSFFLVSRERGPW